MSPRGWLAEKSASIDAGVVDECFRKNIIFIFFGHNKYSIHVTVVMNFWLFHCSRASSDIGETMTWRDCEGTRKGWLEIVGWLVKLLTHFTLNGVKSH